MNFVCEELTSWEWKENVTAEMEHHYNMLFYFISFFCVRREESILEKTFSTRQLLHHNFSFFLNFIIYFYVSIEYVSWELLVTSLTSITTQWFHFTSPRIYLRIFLIQGVNVLKIIIMNMYIFFTVAKCFFLFVIVCAESVDWWR